MSISNHSGNSKLLPLLLLTSAIGVGTVLLQNPVVFKTFAGQGDPSPVLNCGLAVYSDHPNNRRGFYNWDSTIGSALITGQKIVLKMNLNNQEGTTTTVKSQATLPVQFDYMDSDQGCTYTPSTREVSCAHTLAVNETKDFGIRVQRNVYNSSSPINLGVSAVSTNSSCNPSYTLNDNQPYCNAVVAYRDDPQNSSGKYKIDDAHRINLTDSIRPGEKYVIAVWPGPYGEAMANKVTFSSQDGVSINRPLDQTQGCTVQGGLVVCNGNRSLQIKAARYQLPLGSTMASLSLNGHVIDPGDPGRTNANCFRKLNVSPQ